MKNGGDHSLGLAGQLIPWKGVWTANRTSHRQGAAAHGSGDMLYFGVIGAKGMLAQYTVFGGLTDA